MSGSGIRPLRRMPLLPFVGGTLRVVDFFKVRTRIRAYLIFISLREKFKGKSKTK